jgi:hypothetical protein
MDGEGRYTGGGPVTGEEDNAFEIDVDRFAHSCIDIIGEQVSLIDCDEGIVVMHEHRLVAE